MRIIILRWAVGAYCAMLGTLMLVVPHQFTGPGYAWLQLHLPLWGILFQLAGAALIASAALPCRGSLEEGAHLLAGGLLLLRALAFADTGNWVGMIGYAFLGLGTAVAPLVARPADERQAPGLARGLSAPADLLAVLLGLTATVLGVAFLGLPGLFGPTGYDGPVPYLWWHGMLFVAGGPAVLYVQLRPTVPRLAYWGAHLLLASALLAYLVTNPPPSFGLWSRIAYFVGFGLTVALLPWLGPRLEYRGLASLRTRLALALVVAAALPLVAATVMAAGQAVRITRAGAAVEQETLAAALAQNVADYVGFHRAAIVALAGRSGLLELDPDAQRLLLRAVEAAYPEVSAVGMFDRHGNLAAASDGAAVLAQLPLIETVPYPEAPSLNLVLLPPRNTPTLLITAPIADASGRFAGAIVGVVDTGRLSEFLRRANAGTAIETYLVDGSGRLIAHPSTSLTAGLPDLSATPPVAALRSYSQPTGAAFYESAGAPRVVGYAHVPALDWGIIVERPEAAVLAAPRAIGEVAFGVLLVAIAVAALAGAVAAGWLTAPLRVLARAVDKLAAGDSRAPLPHTNVAEVADLAHSFGSMRQQLRAREAERDRAEAALRALNATLEQRVADRTAELSATVEQLEEEVRVRRHTEEAVRAAETRLRFLLTSVPAVIYSRRPTSESGGTFITSGVVALLGYEQQEIVEHPRFWADHVHPNDAPRVTRGLARLFEQDHVTVEYRLRHRDGSCRWVRDDMTLVRDPAGTPVEIVGALSDVTERHQAEEYLRLMAQYDALTSLPNQALFQDRLTLAITQARRSKRAVGLLSLDLDHFKAVNDALGRDVGDLLLQAVANRVTGRLRASDTLARLSGDVYALVLPDLSAVQDAGLVAQKVLDALAAPFELAGHEVCVAASIGIAVCPSDGGDPETLVRKAEAALCLAKQQGGGRWQRHEPRERAAAPASAAAGPQSQA